MTAFFVDIVHIQDTAIEDWFHIAIGDRYYKHTPSTKQDHHIFNK